MHTYAGLGTRLRHALDLMEADVARACADVGLAGYRPRFSPVMRALVDLGPSPIRALAVAVGVTHSAASQTVAQMTRAGLVALAKGADDGRERVVRLTDTGLAALPAIRAEWAATGAAAAQLDRDLPYPLSDLVDALLAALVERPFRDRIADVAADLDDPAVARFRAALVGTR